MRASEVTRCVHSVAIVRPRWSAGSPACDRGWGSRGVPPNRLLSARTGMSTDLAKLGIRLASAQDPEADAEAVAEATRQLRRELLELDVDSVENLRSAD